MGHHEHHFSIPSTSELHNNAGTERYRDTVRVTVIGSVIDLLLGIAKLIVGYFAHSQALIADGVHSLSDLGTDLIVIYAAKHAHREADEEHPYGHGRIETVATVALGTALILVGLGIAWDATDRLFNPDRLLNPTMLAIFIAAISVVSKEAIYHYTMRFAKKYRSKMLQANAWHSRTDAISSVVVIIGVVGTMAGLSYLDAIAAIIVAAMVAKIGWDLSWHAIQELIDTSLDKEMVEEIRDEIMAVDGVVNLHQLRTRRSGSDALADVHIQVDSHISVSEGHQISEAVRRAIINAIPDMTDVIVHTDAEDDDIAASTSHLPLRRELMNQLMDTWQSSTVLADIKRISLHYLRGGIEVDVYLPIEAHQQYSPELLEKLHSKARDLPSINTVRFFFQ
jgi:cation diffusion facilitator family transporter